MKELIDKIDSFGKFFEKYIDNTVEKFDKEVQLLQKELFSRLVTDFATKLGIDPQGFISNTKTNLRFVGELESLFDKYFQLFFNEKMKLLGNDLLKVAQLTKDYYLETGFGSKKVIEDVSSDLSQIRERIGITEKGNLKRDGFLHQLGTAAPVRRQLKDYVFNSIAQKKSLAEYTTGLRQIIVGNKDIDGFLQRYYRQYAYDSFNQVHEIENKRFADALELKYFIYQGSLIKTSRRFCIKRAGKVFTVQDTKTWKNDPDLIDKKTAQSYNPLIERGRYNCRHFLNYISNDLAQYLNSQTKTSPPKSSKTTTKKIKKRKK